MSELALAYKIGAAENLRAPRESGKALQHEFDLRAFQDEILCDGAISPDELEKKRERWTKKADLRASLT